MKLPVSRQTAPHNPAHNNPSLTLITAASSSIHLLLINPLIYFFSFKASGCETFMLLIFKSGLITSTKGVTFGHKKGII